MRITYDPKADVMYVYLNDGTDADLAGSITDLPDEAEGLTLDQDETGHVVGLEIVGASHRLGKTGVNHISLELLEAADDDAQAVDRAGVTVKTA